MVDEEQLSPEEKLLKVIQDGGKTSEEDASDPEATVEASPVIVAEEPEAESGSEAATLEVPEAVVAAAVAEQGEETPPVKQPPKLKLASKKVPSQKTVASPTPQTPTPKPLVSTPDAAKSAGSSGLVGAGPLVTVGKKQKSRNMGLGALNRLLFLVALAMVVLTGWTIWGNMEVSGSRPQASGPPDLNEEGTPTPGMNGAKTLGESNAVVQISGLVPLDKVLMIYEQRPILARPPAQQERTATTRTIQQVIVQTNWEVYIRKNLKLKGLSRIGDGDALEAIVSDKNTGKMHYLKEGDSFLVEKANLKIAVVGKEQVLVTDGTKKVPLK